jgi:eukaryotic-like serine/threonine-protein kinase
LLATEYVPGPTLREHVQAEGPIEGAMLTALAAGLAEALHAIHAAGVVHRDLKPGNVILGSDGPKVLDFGIAQALDATKLTRTGGLVGSPGWIAPERYEGHDATAAADIFAWGGLGQYAVESVVNSDYAPLQAFVLLAAVFTLLVFLLVDLAYFLIDPRIKG